MVTIGALAALVLIRARDALGISVSLDVPGWVVLVFVFMAPASVLGLAWGMVLRAARRLERSGSPALVRGAQRWVAGARALIIGIHVAAIFVLGWTELVRRFIGNLPLLDELVIAAPALFALVGTVAIWHPIELRIREAGVLAQLDRGGAIYPPPALGQHVEYAVRYHVGTLAAPLCLLIASSECVSWLGAWASGPAGSALPGWVREPSTLAWMVPLGQVIAALVALTFAPVLIRWVWDAPSLPHDSLRSELESVLSAHGTAVRDIVVWRTGGTIANAAVVGVFPTLRYLAVTDGMLDALDARELEAVTAHEVAHLRKRHVPWLAGSTLTAVLVAGGASGVGLGLLGVSHEAALVSASIVTVAVALFCIGAVSRRFEWQADAFAASHLSGNSERLSEDGVATMSGALDRVAALNHTDPSRFDWRHGSIRERKQRLSASVGQHLDKLSQDRAVRRLLVGVVILAPIGVALTLLEAWLAGRS
ncbi:MAG: M48 family metalloprotease [Planctomycetota bacterium]